MPPEERRALIRIALLTAILVAAYLTVLLSGPVSVSRARDLGDSGGALAPLVFFLVTVGLTLVSFPLPFTAGAGGLLFGTAEGFALALAACTVGATIAHQLGRHAAGELFARPRDSRIGGLIGRLQERSFVSVLYARILPALPFTIVSYAAGVARVPLLAFVPATLIGASPRVFAYAALGGHLGSWSDPESVVAFAVLAALAIAGLVIIRRGRGDASGRTRAQRRADRPA